MSNVRTNACSSHFCSYKGQCNAATTTVATGSDSCISPYAGISFKAACPYTAASPLPGPVCTSAAGAATPTVLLGAAVLVIAALCSATRMD